MKYSIKNQSCCIILQLKTDDPEMKYEIQKMGM